MSAPVDRLWRAVALDADLAAIQALGQGATQAKATEAAVRKAFEAAIRNGLVTVTDDEDWPEWIEGGPL